MSKFELRLRLDRIDSTLGRIEANQATIINRLAALSAQESKTQMTLEELQTQVDKTRDLEEGAVIAFNGLAAQFAAAKNDPVKIQALSDELAKSGSDLAAAIVNNTPQAPPAPPTPPTA